MAGAALFFVTPLRAAPPAADEAGLDRLRRFLSHVQAVRAEFRQEVTGGTKSAGEKSEGHVVFRQPGRFRWSYEKPFERLLVADGTRVWLYEADLQQATVRAMKAGAGDTPAALLTGGLAVLERFDYLGSSTEDGLLWVRLQPKSAESDFRTVAIGLDGERPARLILNDRLGQETRLSFSRVELNPRVSDREFEFEVPKGVDVIREGEL